MNKYLLDTNVVSELRKPRPHGAVVSWISDRKEEQVFLSAVTMGELQAGIDKNSRSIESERNRALVRPTCLLLSGLADGHAMLSGMGPHYGQETG